MAEFRELSLGDLVAKLGLVAEGEQRFFAARGGTSARDLQHFVRREISPLAGPRRVGEGAVVANVTAELGERDEHLARVRDHVAMAAVSQRRCRGEQRCEVCLLAQRERLIGGGKEAIYCGGEGRVATFEHVGLHGWGAV